jgi:hypothetical protein
MISNLNSWKLSFKNEDQNLKERLMDYFNYEKKIPISYLLNSKKKNFCCVEKIVYEIAEFHFNRLNITFDKTKYIEFWFKKSTNNTFHLDCDEYETNITQSKMLPSPLLSCLVYLNDNDVPTIITNVNKEEYNNKTYSKNNTIALSFPTMLKHITFDGSNNLHGVTNIFENSKEPRYVLAFNLWDKRPKYVPYFDYSTYMYIIYAETGIKIKKKEKISKETKLIDVHINSKNTKTIKLKNRDIINPTFFKNFLNEQKYEDFLKIREMIKEYLKHFDVFLFTYSNN